MSDAWLLDAHRKQIKRLEAETKRLKGQIAKLKEAKSAPKAKAKSAKRNLRT